MDAIKISRFDDYTQNILNETQGQFNDPWDFDFNLESIAHWSGFPRIISWLEFFNRHYYECMLSYSKLIVSVVEIAQKSPLFCAQSKHEQDLSFGFFKSIFRHAKVLTLKGTEESDYLLMVALLFGRYPGMVRGPMGKNLSIKKCLEINDLKNLFEHLFIKYENVRLLTDNLCRLRLVEVEFLMWMTQGNSIRNFRGLPIPISKKESFLFCQSTAIDWKFEEDILERGIIVAKFLKINPELKLLKPFLESNQVFQYYLSNFWSDVQFWYQVYHFMGQVEWEQSRLQLSEYVDYFVYKRTRCEENYEIKGRTRESVERAILLWHGLSEFELDPKLLLLNWGKPQTDKVSFSNKTYVFEEITNGNRLYEESEMMNHCVFSFINGCKAGKFKIWNMSYSGISKKTLLTIQTKGNEIIQIGGRSNRSATELENQIIAKWAENEGYINNLKAVDYYGFA